MRCDKVVVIVSRASAVPVGGLIQYRNWLGNEILNSGRDARPVHIEWHHDRVQIIDPTSHPVIKRISWSQSLVFDLLPHIASRPRTHWIVQKISERILDGITIESVRAVHHVGTGWDLVGFSAHRMARLAHARFTIWPAIHPLQWGDDKIDLRLYSRADFVFCQSAFEAQHLVARGVLPEKVVRCGLPPLCRGDGDAKRFRQIYELGSRPVVLFLGRKDRGKGYPALLRAWRKILDYLPEAVLLVAGTGGEEFVPLLQGLPAHSVRDLGLVDEMSKADALAACDVFCLPSANESFGIVYVEAWSYAKPVVCGTAPASRELVAHGQTGLWTDGSAEDIAAKVTSLLADPALRDAIGNRGKRTQCTQYAPGRMLDIHFAAFGL